MLGKEIQIRNWIRIVSVSWKTLSKCEYVTGFAGGAFHKLKINIKKLKKTWFMNVYNKDINIHNITRYALWPLQIFALHFFLVWDMYSNETWVLYAQHGMMCRGYGQVVKGTGFRDVGVQTYSTTARVQSRKLGISVIVARKLSPLYVTSISACKAEKCLVRYETLLLIRIRPSFLILIWIQLWFMGF